MEEGGEGGHALSNRSTAASPTVADETTVRMALHGVIALE